MPTEAALKLPTRSVRAARARGDASPFIKWVGGKGKLLTQLETLLPRGVHLMRHVEPFLGGGALFFSRAPRRSLLCDVNRDLIETYVAVRDEVDSVLGELRQLARIHGEDSYYAARERYNRRGHDSRAERAALFIYLNKTCFNGLYRVNRSGHFNVPMGRYAKPAIADADTLIAASAGLARAELRCSPFESLLSDAKPGDFVYLDPPYEPVSRTANFTAYASDGFSQVDQTRLRDVFRELDRRGSRLMLSNSDVPFIRELYRGYQIDVVSATRAVNCDPTARGKVQELVVRNYKR
ncbi:MAG: DNA adenine methylase [Polyangiales bacterium]